MEHKPLSASPPCAAPWPAAPVADAPARPVRAPARRRARAPETKQTRREARPPARPFPPETGWACEISWRANLLSAGFLATATAPGLTARVIAESPKVSWPPLLPPVPDEDEVTAVRALVHDLRAAGWTPVSRGAAWYAQRFVWAGEKDPEPLA